MKTTMKGIRIRTIIMIACIFVCGIIAVVKCIENGNQKAVITMYEKELQDERAEKFGAIIPPGTRWEVKYDTTGMYQVQVDSTSTFEVTTDSLTQTMTIMVKDTSYFYTKSETLSLRPKRGTSGGVSIPRRRNVVTISPENMY